MNRPLDYEHRLAKLVPNDIVTPTTEVVKEEQQQKEPEAKVGKSKDWIEDAYGRIMQHYKPHFVGVDLAAKGTEAHRFVINHHGNLEITKVDIQAEEEPQTGWRFLGFDGEEAFVGGVFVPGAVYQIIPGTKYEFYAQFVDEEGDAMHAELVYFEQVK